MYGDGLVLYSTAVYSFLLFFSSPLILLGLPRGYLQERYY